MRCCLLLVVCCALFAGCEKKAEYGTWTPPVMNTKDQPGTIPNPLYSSPTPTKPQ